MRGAPPVSREAHTLLSAALDPEMTTRIDLPEFKRQFLGISEFFAGLKATPSASPAAVAAARIPGLTSDDGSDQDSDGGPATPDRMLSHPESGHVYEGDEQGRKMRQPSTGIRAWLRRLVVRPSSSSGSR